MLGESLTFLWTVIRAFKPNGFIKIHEYVVTLSTEWTGMITRVVFTRNTPLVIVAEKNSEIPFPRRSKSPFHLFFLSLLYFYTSFLISFFSFLVADTRLYILLCWSVHPIVPLAVHPPIHHTVEIVFSFLWFFSVLGYNKVCNCERLFDL